MTGEFGIWLSAMGGLVLGASLSAVMHAIASRRAEARREARLALSEGRYRDLVNNTAGIVWEADPTDFTVTFVSRQAESLLGYPIADWLEAGFWADHLHPGDRQRVTELRADHAARRQPYDLEYRFLARDGRTVWLRDTGALVVEAGGAACLRGLLIDVTRYKEVLIALAENEQRWKFAIEGAGDCLWDWDLVGNKVFYSGRWKTMLGFADEEIGDSIDEFWRRVHPDDSAGLDVALQEHFAAGKQTLEREFRLQCKDGSWKWIVSRGMVIARGTADQPLRMIGTHRDITQRKTSDIELDAANRFQQSLLNAAPYAIIAIRPDGTISHFSKGAERMLGYAASEVIDRLSIAALHDATEIAEKKPGRSRTAAEHPEIEPLVGDATRAEYSENEWTLIRKDGSRFPALLSATALHDENGAINGFLGIAMDITERRRADAKIRRAIFHAESATRAKSEFIAHMSHEIRTPMNAIVGAARLLAEENLTPHQLTYTRIMQHSSHLLMSLIDDILDFSKIEAGRIELKKDTFSLAPIMDGLAGLASVSAEGKPIEINFDLAPDLPPSLIGDPSRLEQVLNNLLSNAIKFTANGEIILEVRRELDVVGNVRLRFTVSDTGIGIPANKLDAIFDPFVQAEHPTIHAHHGTGLGLTISRRLVEMMGGVITVESTPGQGSRFSFSALFQLPPQPEAAKGAPPWMAGRRIGLIEPNATTRKVISGLLRAQGADVVSSASCGEACLCGIEPPVEVLIINKASALRALEAGTLARQRPLILTVHSNAEKEAWPGGDSHTGAIVGHLVKPVTLALLSNCLGVVQGIIGADHPVAANATRLPLAGRRVLMVDDNQFNRVVLAGMLQRLEIEVDTAIDGHDAIACFHSSGPYDAILMDLHMPGLNGFDCTRAIRALPGGARVPIIAVTADVLPATTDLCRVAGMDDHLVKPIEPDTLLRSLMYWILKREHAAPAEAPPQAHPIDVVPDDLPGIDRAQAIKWCSSSARALATLLDKLFATCGDDPDRLARFLAEGRIDAAAQITHDLVSVATTVGATALATAASQMNREIRGGRTNGIVAKRTLASIVAEFGQLDAARHILWQQLGTPAK